MKRKMKTTYPVHVCILLYKMAIVGSLNPGKKAKSMMFFISAEIGVVSRTKLDAYGKLDIYI